MRHSDYTDYSLRVLMYCATHSDKLVTISEIAQFYKISNNHLMKIVHALSLDGFITTTRGRNGGISLQRLSNEIRIDEVVKRTELDFKLVECFDTVTNQCVLSPSCKLKQVFQAALQAYLGELSKVTLADIVELNNLNKQPSLKTINISKQP
jgi:Rrf2 family transcriptional regulator, nitric oxide-sensitive transcriptional repressor